jgi:RNA polymerase sigma-70 factor (ECF subfamily)
MSSPSFAQAAERHLDDVYGYLAWFTGDRFAAEDLAGETFERALRLWHRFDPERGSARTWLCQVARTVALDHFRSERRRTRREQLASVPDVFEQRVAEGLSPELESALARLTAGEREVIALRVILDLDAGAAARVLAISATNCTTRLNRALKKLEEAIHVAA